MTHIRRRGTAIAETSEGTLVVAGRSGLYLLPGGAARKGESRTNAAIRELREETVLIATSPKFLFCHVGHTHKSYSGGYFRYHYTVVHIQADGIPTPRHEIKNIGYFHPNSKINISRKPGANWSKK